MEPRKERGKPRFNEVSLPPEENKKESLEGKQQF
jgi:hypothetical protein